MAERRSARATSEFRRGVEQQRRELSSMTITRFGIGGTVGTAIALIFFLGWMGLGLFVGGLLIWAGFKTV
jgi:hypothetical protein